MKQRNRKLNVLMNGILVGKLEKDARGGVQFAYDQHWLNLSGARPISFSLPLIEKVFAGDIVYNFFDNLLPDNPQIRSRIQSKFNISTNHPFDLLESIGKDCVGAIQIAKEMPHFPKIIKYEPIDNKTISQILRGYQEYPLGMRETFSEFRISIAGAQEKTAFLYHNQKWNIPLNETPTTHIFKLPIGFIPHQQLDLRDSCENEWLCSLIAKEFGLQVAKCEILYFEDIKALVVERFDRKLSHDKKWIMRLPQEDMCQVLGFSSNLKYQADGGPGIKSIMQFLLGSREPAHDREIFYRTQVLFWILAAIDGHAKNFSVFIEPEGKYRLTPLYDVMSAYPLFSKKQLQPQKAKMAMCLIGKNNHYHWFNIHRKHFIETAKTAGFSLDKATSILDEMLNQVDDVIEKTKAKLPDSFPLAVSEPIFEGMRQMKQKLSTH